jgi:hypothetical protein
MTTNISTDLAGHCVTLAFQRNHEIEAIGTEPPERVPLICSGNLKISFNDLGGTFSPK